MTGSGASDDASLSASRGALQPEARSAGHEPDTMFDVAILGYGPVGATLANLLGQAGLRVAVFEREASIYHAPRAGHFDAEVMRVFQGIGLADEIGRRTLVRPGARFENASGGLLADWPRPRVLGPQGWYPSYCFHQPYLETALRDGVARYPTVQVYLRHEVFSVEPEPHQVRLRFENLADGTLGATTARYVVGCDGARSTVRRFMGVELEDLGLHERWLIVDIALRHPMPSLPEYLVHICDPARPVTMMQMVEHRRRWEFMLLEGDDPDTIAQGHQVWPLLARWLTPEDADIERAVVYSFHSVMAREWRRGRLMIAGDAAHQTPPFMGQGMCTGIRDAVNLAWKLVRVVRGQSQDTLLDTYTSERKPHAREYIETAIRLGAVIQTTDPEVAAARDAEMLARPTRMHAIAPQLGPGLLAEGAARPAGALVAQPRLVEGTLLDDRVGSRFALVVRTGVDAALLPVLERLDVVLIDAAAFGIEAFLDDLAVDAIVLRPDRYVLGVAVGAAQLRTLIDSVPEACHASE